MALIGNCWQTTSWVSAGGWVLGSWRSFVAAVEVIVAAPKRRGRYYILTRRG